MHAVYKMYTSRAIAIYASTAWHVKCGAKHTYTILTTSRGSLSFEVASGAEVCSEVKCLGDGLLESNLPPRHFTSGGGGGKLLQTFFSTWPSICSVLSIWVWLSGVLHGSLYCALSIVRWC